MQDGSRAARHRQSDAGAPAAAEEPKKKGLGGMLGGLKKMAEAAEKNQQRNAKPQRAIIMTTSVEMLKLTTDVDAASVAMPAGFTEREVALTFFLAVNPPCPCRSR